MLEAAHAESRLRHTFIITHSNEVEGDDRHGRTGGDVNFMLPGFIAGEHFLRDWMSFESNFFGIFNARNIVFVAMFAVGALCIFMSARNTASYLMLTDRLISVMTGIALIVFSATSC